MLDNVYQVLKMFRICYALGIVLLEAYPKERTKFMEQNLYGACACHERRIQ